MSFGSRHNKGTIFDIDTKDWEFKSLKDLYEAGNNLNELQGLYISNKSKFGPSPVAICKGYCVNLPAHMVEEVKDILANEEDIADIKAGKVGFTVETYKDKTYNKDCYGIKWADIL